MGLETVGIHAREDGTFAVDDRLRIRLAGVWAAGDIRGGPAFTHTAYDDFRVLQSQLLDDGSDDQCRIVPYAIFTEPELGRVGMSEAEARQAGRLVRMGWHAMADSGKARELGKTDGFIKVVVDGATGEILGATALCEREAEIVQLFVDECRGNCRYDPGRGPYPSHAVGGGEKRRARNVRVVKWAGRHPGHEPPPVGGVRRSGDTRSAYQRHSTRS